MKKQDVDRISLRAYSIKQWLARQTPQQRRVRRELEDRSELKWWLVYGPPRCGTSYMMRLVKACSTLYVSDWSLGAFLRPIPGWIDFKSLPVHDYIAFDYERFLKDISRNILDNAYAGDGDQLHLIYKQAALHPEEYQVFVRMWGPPERAIFCLREPSGYVASAGKKFSHAPVEWLQKVYLESLDSYLHIKGDVFEYAPELSLSDYLSFLGPLNFEGKRLPPFQYRGNLEQEHTSAEMWAAYQRLKDSLAD